MEHYRTGLYAACECDDQLASINKSAEGAICFVMVANDIRINGTGSIYAQSPAGAGVQGRGIEHAKGDDPKSPEAGHLIKKERPKASSPIMLRLISTHVADMCVKNFDNSLNKILMAAFGKATQKASALKTDERGASALEFGIFAGIHAFGLLNTADISIYIYKRMQVENATKWRRRLPGRLVTRPRELPATLSCPNLTTAMTQAAQSTALGNQVTIATGSPQEGLTALMTRARFSISPMRTLIRRPIVLQPGCQVSNPGITFGSRQAFLMHRCFQA